MQYWQDIVNNEIKDMADFTDIIASELLTVGKLDLTRFLRHIVFVKGYN